MPPDHPTVRRVSASPSCASTALRAWRQAGLGLAVALLAGCAAPLPPLVRVKLPLHAEPVETAPATPATQASQATWQLVGPVELPRHLDQATVWATGGDGRQHTLGEWRWAEPLQEALTQRLQLDLSTRLHREVWGATWPPGTAPSRQLRVVVQDLELRPDLGLARIDARWSTADRAGGRPPEVFQRRLELPLRDTSPQAVAQTYRRLVWRLSGAVADTLKD